MMMVHFEQPPLPYIFIHPFKIIHEIRLREKERIDADTEAEVDLSPLTDGTERKKDRPTVTRTDQDCSAAQC